MYKFFVEDEQIYGNNIKIIGEDIKHIDRVLRLKTSDEIIICNKETGKSYVAEILDITKDYINCIIKNDVLNSTESNIEVDLFQGLPKLDKMEYIIQKSTELGVKNIYPVAFERSIVKIDEKNELKKIERWQKIAEVASKQSKRDYIPTINNVINIENICKKVSEYDMILLAFENENNFSLKDALSNTKKNNLKIGIVVGPEGGISEKEVTKLTDAGIKCITLGKRILRTETASLMILSNIIYEFEL